MARQPKAAAQAAQADPEKLAGKDGEQAPDNPPATEAAVAAEKKDAPRAESVKEDDGVDALWIRSVPPSFRRAGFRFTREGLGIALDVLTADQVRALEREPNLVVKRCAIPVDGDHQA